MKVQLLTFPDCPNADAARTNLREAIRAEAIGSPIEEIDIGKPGTPPTLRGWGSPTILIDGSDLLGVKPSGGEIGCRLYAGGAPSVEQIRSRLRGDGTKLGGGLPVVGALFAAIAASACCILPAILAIVGLSSAGLAAKLAPLRPYFLVLTGAALLVGLWLTYRRAAVCADASCCPAPRSRRIARIGLWLGVALTIGIAAYPSLLDGNASVKGEARRGVAEIRLHVDGMDCKACAPTLAKKLARVPGVVTADVDYDAQLAIVSHDGTRDPMRDLLDAIEALGYRGSPARP